MVVLVLNCGSATVKFEVIVDGERRPLRGMVDRLGPGATLVLRRGDASAERRPVDAPDHTAAVGAALDCVRAAVDRVDAVGHRVVHGGPRFRRSVPIDDAVVEAIHALEELAPLHNAPGLAGIRASRARLGPGVPMVAVFDTSFHATLPERAATYALPRELAERHAIRRYGFHGTAFRSVLRRYAALAGTPADRVTVVALHLGSGCSAAAVREGRSIDTSMGMTPLEGLVMGTRSGDLDPSLPGFLARREGVPVAEVEDWLNHRAGLRGLSGTSNDMRDLLAREAHDPRAGLAVDVFCYRARKYVGAYLAALEGAQALLFSGGIGEGAPEVRARICAGLGWCGLALDAEANARAVGEAARISAPGAGLAVWVVPADEALVIAEDTEACLAGRLEEAAS